jgi:hypothetical protein
MQQRTFGHSVSNGCCVGSVVDSARSNPMLDVIMLALGLGFFAVALAYVAGCERL